MSDFERSDREPKVLVREPQHLCPNCGDDRTGKGSLIVTGTPSKAFCNERCFMEWQQGVIAELGRHNELLRAVVSKAHVFIDRATFLDIDPRTAGYADALQAAIDGGALDKDGEK